MMSHNVKPEASEEIQVAPAPRRLRIRASAVVLFFFLTFYGCASNNQVAAPENIEMRLASDKKLSEGSCVHITATITNRSKRSVAITKDISGAAFFLFSISRRGGTLIEVPGSHTDFSTDNDLPSYECLAPGDELEVDLNLAPDFASLRKCVKKGDLTIPLNKGVYMLRVKYWEVRRKARCSLIRGEAVSDWIEVIVQ